MLNARERVPLTAEDKQKFKESCKTANPIEILTVAAFVEDHAKTLRGKRLTLYEIANRATLRTVVEKRNKELFI